MNYIVATGSLVPNILLKPAGLEGYGDSTLGHLFAARIRLCCVGTADSLCKGAITDER